MRPLLLVVLAFFAAPAAAFGGVSLTVREVPLHGERTLAAATPQFDMVGLHWRGTGTVQFRTRSLARPMECLALARTRRPRTFRMSGVPRRGPRAAGVSGTRTGPAASDRIAYRLRGRCRATTRLLRPEPGGPHPASPALDGRFAAAARPRGLGRERGDPPRARRPTHRACSLLSSITRPEQTRTQPRSPPRSCAASRSTT